MGSTPEPIARVSRKTVFTAVGGKAALLKLAWDWAIVGDDEPVPMAERAAVRDLQAQTDPDRLLELWAGFAAEVSARLAPLHAVLRAAADVDEEAAAVLATTDGERRAGAHGIVGGLVRLGALRPGLPVERAADLAALLMDPASYAELVGRRAWSHAEYVEWLARAARASFLEG